MTETEVVIDGVGNRLRISRVYSAGVDRAWWAWTDPKAVSRWWGPADWSATIYEMDVRPGGRWRFQLTPTDRSFESVRGIATYRQVRPGVELRYDDAFADAAWQPDTSTVFPTAVTFTATDHGCRVDVDVDFATTESLRRAVDLHMADGYAQALDRLDALLTTMQGEPSMNTLTSTDGTVIAYTTTGTGPPLIVISNGPEDHTAVAPLVASLAQHFTVTSFDRRGRGGSGDPQPYDPAREIDDIGMLIDIAGGTAGLTGASGACAITLDAASALGDRVSGVCVFDPPFFVDDTYPTPPADYVARVEELIAADRRSDAVEYVMTAVIGVPEEYIEPMKEDPSWNDMVRYAHTFVYEGRSLDGLMDGTPLPEDRWSIQAPITVVVGEHSEPHFLTAAQALASLLPDVTVTTLEGQGHGAFWAAPEPVTEQIRTAIRPRTA